MLEDLYFYTYKKCYYPLDGMPLDEADYCLIGIPFDSTQTGKTGSRYGPTSIRLSSFELELFDIGTGVDLSELKLHDIGDLDCVPGSPEGTYERAKDTLKFLPEDKTLISLGGEHSISLPIVEALNPDLVISLDAHPDLRDDYMGIRLSHSSVMRRIHETGKDLQILGVREGSKEEYDYAIDNGIDLKPPSTMAGHKIPKKRDVYISIDLDVFDNVDVGNPVPGGISFTQGCEFIRNVIKRNNIVGLDIVELCSQPNEGSSYFAAKLLYKALAYMQKYSI